LVLDFGHGFWTFVNKDTFALLHIHQAAHTHTHNFFPPKIINISRDGFGFWTLILDIGV